MKKIKILFAEDHELVRNGIKLMLSAQKSFKAEITEAADGVEAIQKACTKQFDIILLDISLPLRNGIDVATILNSKLKDPKIIMLTMHNDDYMIQKALKANIMGYVLKSAGIEELVNAILSVYAGKKYYSNDVSQIIINGKNHPDENIMEQKSSDNMKEFYKLTKRELEILRHISTGATDRELAEIFSISSRTAGNHRSNLLHKLNVKNSIELVAVAIKTGLV